jgi:4-hydroxyphenylpyruvate dioxygenase
MFTELRRLLGFRAYVRDLERTRRYYAQQLGFFELGHSSAELEASERQRSLLFAAGNSLLVCSTPLADDADAARYLSRHPDGVAALLFEVSDARAAFERLEQRGATPTSDLRGWNERGNDASSFSITTPIGDTQFQFIERPAAAPLLPGFVCPSLRAIAPAAYSDVDHVTVNLRTLKPTLLWLEHVLGFERFWGVEFHTGEGRLGGSGLRSCVMWHPASGFKLACNEPLRPGFERSQVSLFCDDNRGDGVQHVALGVGDLIGLVRQLRARGVELMPAPAGYYADLPARLRRLGIRNTDEARSELAELGILVDGAGPGHYLLQIFARDAASLWNDRQAGPFFFEFIQRKGHAGFGEGNFRALFDSIEATGLPRAG